MKKLSFYFIFLVIGMSIMSCKTTVIPLASLELYTIENQKVKATPTRGSEQTSPTSFLTLEDSLRVDDLRRVLKVDTPKIITIIKNLPRRAPVVFNFRGCPCGELSTGCPCPCFNDDCNIIGVFDRFPLSDNVLNIKNSSGNDLFKLKRSRRFNLGETTIYYNVYKLDKKYIGPATISIDGPNGVRSAALEYSKGNFGRSQIE